MDQNYRAKIRAGYEILLFCRRQSGNGRYLGRSVGSRRMVVLLPEGGREMLDAAKAGSKSDVSNGHGCIAQQELCIF